MKKGESRIITIPGRWQNETLKIEVKFLGKGEFSTCYTDGESVYSFVKNTNNETDYTKQGISLYAEKNIHIPQFKILGDVNNCEVFKSPLYQPLTKDYSIAWQQAKVLQVIWNRSYSIYFNDTCYNGNEKLIDMIKSDNRIPETLINALISINDVMANYGEYYRFEFQKRNLAVDEQGNLILLDVIFNTHALKSFKSS